MMDLADVARARNRLRAQFTDKDHATLARLGLDCPCVVPWWVAPWRPATGGLLGLCSVHPHYSAVNNCVMCDGNGRRRERRFASGAMHVRVHHEIADRASRSDVFPMPTHMLQPGVTWEDASDEVAAISWSDRYTDRDEVTGDGESVLRRAGIVLRPHRRRTKR